MRPYLAAHRGDATISVAAALLGMVLTALQPVIQRDVIDDGILSTDKAIGPLLLLLAATGLARFVLGYVRRFFGGRVSLDVQHDLRTAIFERLQRLDFARHDELQTGQLVSRCQLRHRADPGLLCSSCRSASATSCMFVVSLVVMLFLSPLLTLVSCSRSRRCSSSRCACAASVFPAHWDAQQQAGEVAGVVDEAVTGVRVVKGFGQEDRELGASRRRGARPVRVAGARLVRLQARYAAGAADDPAARPGRRCSRSAAGSRSRATSPSARSSRSPPTSCSSSRRSGCSPASSRVGQQARAGRRAHLRPARLHPARARRSPTPTTPVDVARRGRFDHVSFGYLAARAGAATTSPSRRAGRDGRARRRSGLGQVDGRAAAAPLLRRARRRGARRRLDVRDVDARLAAPRSRRRVRGPFLFSDTVRANIAFGRPDATDDRGRGRGRAAGGARVHHGAARRLRHRGRRAGPHALGRPAPAHRARAALLTDPEDPGARRRDVVGRRRDRGGDPRHAARAHGATAPRSSSRTAARRCASPTASSWSTTAACSTSGTHEELLARCALYRVLLAGPGDDGRRIGRAVDRRRAARHARSTASRRRRRGIAPTAAERRRGHVRDRRRDARLRPAFGGRRRRIGGGAVAAWRRSRWRATPELLAQVDALAAGRRRSRGRRRRRGREPDGRLHVPRVPAARTAAARVRLRAGRARRAC